MSLIKLRYRTMTGAVISRIKHQNEVEAPGRKSKLYLGDIVRVVGTEDALQRAQLLIGEVTDEKIPQSDSIDVQIAGHRGLGGSAIWKNLQGV